MACTRWSRGRTPIASLEAARQQIPSPGRATPCCSWPAGRARQGRARGTGHEQNGPEGRGRVLQRVPPEQVASQSMGCQVLRSVLRSGLAGPGSGSGGSSSSPDEVPCLKSRTPVLNLVRLLPRLHTHTVLAPTAPSDTAPRGRSGTPLTLGQYTIRTPDFDTPPFSRENPHMLATFIGNAHPMLPAVHKLGTFKAIAPT